MNEAILRPIGSSDDEYTAYVFFCPGCKTHHSFNVAHDCQWTPRFWGFNGDMQKPTFTPSLLCNPQDPKSRCHSFVKNGHIQFLGDCWHKLKGQTVPLPPHQWD